MAQTAMELGAVATGPGYELRCGDWRDVLADVERVDAVITDPPYSERVENGFRSGNTGNDVRNRPGMGYAFITDEWASHFVSSWHPRCSGWAFICGDHITSRWFEDALQAVNRCVFPPVAIVKTGAAPRMSCDGPGSHVEYAMVARPREKRFLSWGSLPGWYPMQTVRHGHGHIGVSGAKSLPLMRAIVRDYTRPGDLVCDPCAGGGTTLLAAVLEGRRAIGADLDPTTFAKAANRLERETRDRVYVERPGEAPRMRQQALQLGGKP